ncbi:MAG TPA: anti-sigma factor [Gaiellaceae bacterium]|jgi:anti-sigma-K factor RskA
MTTNQDLHEQVAAYALDALDEDERRAYEEHLAGCERCREELAGLADTAGALGLASGAADPPDALRGRILDAARAEGPSNVVAIGSARRRRFAVVGGVAAAVAAAALAIGLYAALSGGGTSKELAVSVGGGVARATVSGFDAAPAGKTYELWVIEGKTPRPAGLFEGGDEQVITLTRPAPAGSTVAVTLERAGGATTPTLPILEQTTVSA